VVTGTDVADRAATPSGVVPIHMPLDADAQLIHLGKNVTVEVLVFEDEAAPTIASSLTCVGPFLELLAEIISRTPRPRGTFLTDPNGSSDVPG